MPRLNAPASATSGTLPRNGDPRVVGTGQVSITANRRYYYRVTEGDRQTCSKIAIQIEVTDATANLSLAVHRNTGSGASALPGARVASTGSVLSPGTGVQQIALDVPVEVGPGDWLSIAVDTVATIRLLGVAGIVAGLGSLGLAAYQDAAHTAPATAAATAGLSSRWFPLVAVP